MLSYKGLLFPLLFEAITAFRTTLQSRQTAWPITTYETVAFHSPQYSITKSGLPLADGLLFITPAGVSAIAANIFTDDGDLIWSTELGTTSYSNLLAQELHGKAVLTFWNGSGSADPAEQGHGFGHVSILDNTYKEIFRICPELNIVAPNGLNVTCGLDIHESLISKRGTLLATVYNETTADLTSVGGPANGWVWDSLFLEIDIETQQILFRWSATESGIPIAGTHANITNGLNGNGTQSNPFDWFHINAIQDIGGGYLVNSRHLGASFLLCSEGKIVWSIEGDNNGGNFTLSPSNAGFSWQHYARLRNVTSSSAILTYFDNNNAAPPFNGSAPSQGLEFSLDFEAKTASLLKNLTDPTEELYADSQGAFEPQSNGNYLAGYGQIPIAKEFGPDGDVRLTVQYGARGLDQSYRTLRRKWTATPYYPPAAVVKNGTVFVSWNGATEVTDWAVFDGDSNTTYAHFSKVLTFPKTGFETSSVLPGNYTFIKVAAYDGKHQIGESAIIQV